MKKLLPLLVCVVAIFAVGCAVPGAVGRMASTQKSYSGTEHLKLPPGTAVQAIPRAIEVGKQLGYSVSGKDSGGAFESVTLVSGNSQAERTFLGHSETHRIMIRQNGDDLNITYIASGNFGAAESNKAEQLLQDFKTRLLAGLGGNDPHVAATK